MTAPTARRESPPALLDRVEIILGSFADRPQQTLAEVARNTALPRSTTHRLLEQLVQMRWLHRNGREYELGTRMIEFGTLAVEQSRIHSAAVPILHELHRRTGHVVHLGILEGPDVLYTHKVGGADGRIGRTRVGSRHPAIHSPIGQVLLACSGRFSRLPATLERVRADQLACVGNSRTCGIGAPIGPTGRAVAALSIAAPVGDLSLDRRSAAPVRMAAAAISRALTGADSVVAPILAQRNPMTRAAAAHRYLRGACRLPIERSTHSLSSARPPRP